MQLTPVSHRVTDFEFHKNEFDSDDFQIDFRADFFADRKFKIIFDLILTKKTEGYFLKAEYETVFTTSEDITDDFKQGHFPKLNGPAIAFPFLRAFISYITLTAGFPPVILPSINFVKLNQDMKK